MEQFPVRTHLPLFGPPFRCTCCRGPRTLDLLPRIARNGPGGGARGGDGGDARTTGHTNKVAGFQGSEVYQPPWPGSFVRLQCPAAGGSFGMQGAPGAVPELTSRSCVGSSDPARKHRGSWWIRCKIDPRASMGGLRRSSKVWSFASFTMK